MTWITQKFGIRTVACMVGLLGTLLPAQAAQWTIQPDCRGQSLCFTHPQDLHDWRVIAPGDTVLLMPDSQGTGWQSRAPGAASLSIDQARGSPEKRITVVGVNGAKLLQGLNVNRSQYLGLINLDVTENRVSALGVGSAAVTLQGGSAAGLARLKTVRRLPTTGKSIPAQPAMAAAQGPPAFTA